jgi:hypothetical protein
MEDSKTKAKVLVVIARLFGCHILTFNVYQLYCKHGGEWNCVCVIVELRTSSVLHERHKGESTTFYPKEDDLSYTPPGLSCVSM